MTHGEMTIQHAFHQRPGLDPVIYRISSLNLNSKEELRRIKKEELRVCNNSFIHDLKAWTDSHKRRKRKKSMFYLFYFLPDADQTSRRKSY